MNTGLFTIGSIAQFDGKEMGFLRCRDHDKKILLEETIKIGDLNRNMDPYEIILLIYLID